MDTPHFRGPQLPTSHVVPGAPGAPGHPPHFGFAEPPPPFIIPAAFLTEIMMAVRSESAAQNRLLSNHYTNLKQDYNAIKDDFQLCVHQTDRILTEQYTRFELRLEGIQRGMQQFTVAIGDLGVRLDALEGATKASRETLTSDIAAVVETMGREFTTVVAMIKGEPLTLPIMDNTDVTTVPPPPSTIPEVIPITPSADHEPPQSPLPQDTTLFDAPSPLTPVSTPSSPDQEEYQSTSPEIEIPAPHPEPADPTPRKRRRASQGRRSTKRLRRGRKPYPRETQEDASHEVQQPEEDYADPLIWPPLIEDGISDQSYVECDRCEIWFHFGCVGLRADHGDGTPWECPLCVQYPTRNAVNAPPGHGMCSRPGCAGAEIEEYFLNRLIGRCYVADQNMIKYLVAYEGYGLDQCTWEAPESFSHDSGRIEDFLEWWAIENPGVEVESLDPHETIFLHDAHVLARTGFTWPGGCEPPFCGQLSPPQ